MNVILLSFLGNVYIESKNVRRVKSFTHLSQSVQAITQIRFILLQWHGHPPHPYD